MCGLCKLVTNNVKGAGLRVVLKRAANRLSNKHCGTHSVGGDKLSHLQQLKTLTLTWFTSSGQPPLNCSWLRQTPSFSAGCDVHCVLDIWTFTTWCYVKTVSQWTAVCTLFLLARGQLKRWIGNCHKVAKPTDSARGCQPSPVSQTPVTWHPSPQSARGI